VQEKLSDLLDEENKLEEQLEKVRDKIIKYKGDRR
jgi:hypothetical protein